MGNISASDLNKNESAINISDSCIHKLSNQKTKDSKKSKPVNLPSMTDDQWKAYLNKLDETHTEENKLTVSRAEHLMDHVEIQIDTQNEQSCSAEKLISCLTKNRTCTIRCKQYVDEFLDCINKSRVDIIKENFAEYQRCQELETRKLEQNMKVNVGK